MPHHLPKYAPRATPRKHLKAERLQAAGLKVVDIHDLAAKARSIIGEPDALPFGDRVVGIVMDRHGKVLDEIHNIVD